MPRQLAGLVLLLGWFEARAQDWAGGDGWAALSAFFGAVYAAAALFGVSLCSGLLAAFKPEGGAQGAAAGGAAGGGQGG